MKFSGISSDNLNDETPNGSDDDSKAYLTRTSFLSLQIRNDNSIYMEFRDKINLDIENNMYSLFFQKIKETNLEFKMNFEKKNGYNNIFILLDEDNDEDKFSKFDKIINIIISLSKIN